MSMIERQAKQKLASIEADGAYVLDIVHSFLGRFVCYPEPASQVAHTLWCAHTHVIDAFDSTPRLAFLSPEKASGKTRALELSYLLVPNAVQAVNVSPSYIFRKVGDEGERPTLLFDEIDTIFGPKAGDNESLRGLLNAGYRRGAVAGRCVTRGNTICTEELPAFCAVALAGLGDLPDTLMSRSVIVRMKRRAADQKIEPYRNRPHSIEGERIYKLLAKWASEAAPSLEGAYPDMPEGVEDRSADIWEPLLAVADAAGDHWPDSARQAAAELVAKSKDQSISLGVRLLTDLKQVFGDKRSMFTSDILSALNQMDEAPWGNLYGQPLDARGLASRLKKYQIQPKQIRIGDQTAKGYSVDDLHDAWVRYCPQDDQAAA